MSSKGAYPKPKETGGRLIREVIGFLRRQKIDLPMTSHILIAVSGGPDSIALAHLLLKYGRRIAPKEKISLLHVDHGWRGKSAADARFVQAFARQWGVHLRTKKLKSPDQNTSYQGRSWEETARELRKQFFEKEANKKKAVVLTAHQADDLAETLLWRLFTGSASTHGGGISVQHGVELRPFLPFRKTLLLDYLKEEGQSYQTDETNFDLRFLRAQMRQNLLPVIEKIFPKAIDHLVKLGLQAQSASGLNESGDTPGPELLFQVAGIRQRRAHLEAIQSGRSVMDLPGGWRLSRQSGRAIPDQSSQNVGERWILERLNK